MDLWHIHDAPQVPAQFLQRFLSPSGHQRKSPLNQGAFSLVSEHMLRNVFLIALSTLAVSAAVLAVFWPGLNGGFFFDDFGNILQNESVRLHEFTYDAVHAA